MGKLKRVYIDAKLIVVSERGLALKAKCEEARRRLRGGDSASTKSNRVVYVLRCNVPGYYYIGETCNLERRLQEHREGKGSEFTRKYGVAELVEVIPNGSEFGVYWRYRNDPKVKWACGADHSQSTTPPAPTNPTNNT